MDDLIWRKSRRSNDQGHECVELASFPKAVAVRDSKDPDGARLVLDRSAFRALVNDLKQH